MAGIERRKARPGAKREQRNNVVAKTIVAIRKDTDVAGKSKGLPEEHRWAEYQGTATLIEPPYDTLVLAMMPEHNSELMQCVEAMEINIDGFGHRVKSRVSISQSTPDDVKRAIDNEISKMNSWMDMACIEHSFPMLRRMTRRDMETTGNGYWEVVPHPYTGKPDQIVHMPSHTMRLSTQDNNFTEFERPAIEIIDGKPVKKMVKGHKRFRRIVQSRDGKYVFFKEWFDPRNIDCVTGDVIPEEQLKEAIEKGRLAHPAIHFKLYCPRSPYGLPRWIGNLFSIYGSRAAEEINYTTFTNNNVPSMAVLVSNGQLTKGSIGRIQEYVDDLISRSDNYSKFLILEAEQMFEDSDGASGQVKVEIKPMNQAQIQDAMFQEYDKNNNDKVRRAFRLPPIYVGSTSDYTRSTAEVSRKLADEQVFNPERQEFDWTMNRTIMPALGAIWTLFVSNTPNVTHDEDLIRLMVAAEKAGGMTPQLAREIVADVMGRDLPKVEDDDVPANTPYTLTIAREAKKQGPINQGTVGAQKSVGGNATFDMLVAALLDFREGISQELAKREAAETAFFTDEGDDGQVTRVKAR